MMSRAMTVWGRWHGKRESEDSNKERGRDRARRKTVANTTTGKHNIKWKMADKRRNNLSPPPRKGKKALLNRPGFVTPKPSTQNPLNLSKDS